MCLMHGSILLNENGHRKRGQWRSGNRCAVISVEGPPLTLFRHFQVCVF